MLRAGLLRIGAEDHVLLLTLHHVAADARSLDILEDELATLYGWLAGRPGGAAGASPLSELPLQYADFAAWQRKWVRGAALERLVAAWQDRFGASLAPLALPTDRPRPPLPDDAGGYRERPLQGEVATAARALTGRFGVTLFIALLAAFQALLHRLSRQAVVTVGSPIAGRTRPEVEGLAGMFVNTVVLPVSCAGDPSFEAFLGRVRETALAAYALQDLPFDKLVEALRPEREMGASPLFQVMFALEHERPAPRREAGLRFAPVALDTTTSQFDLTLYIEERAGILVAGAEYSTALFDAATVERLLAAYEELLAAAAVRPRTALSRLPVAPVFLTGAGAPGRAAGAPAGRGEAAAGAKGEAAAGAKGEAAAGATAEAAAPAEAGAAASGPAGPRVAGDEKEKETALVPAAPAAAERLDRVAARLARLTPAQREALERRRRGEVAGPTPAAAGLGVLVPLTASSGSGRRPLFCVHPAGGDALCFVPLARLLGADQPVYGLQSRGLAPGEQPLRTLEEMAALYVEHLRRVQPHGPYLLGGWSFGGLAAFEMANQLRAAGEAVALLAIVDTGPGLEEPEAPLPAELADERDPSSWLLEIAAYVKGLWGKDLRLSAADLRPLGAEDQLRLFLARARAAELVYQADSADRLRRVLAVFRANTLAYRSYRPRVYDGRITVFRPAGAVRADEPRDLGWGRFSAVAVDCQEVPGTHLTLLAEPHVADLARRLRGCLDAAQH